MVRFKKKKALRLYLNVGDFVRVKSSVHTKKGKGRFSEPVRVIKIGNNAVQVEGGHWWNLSKLVKARSFPSLQGQESTVHSTSTEQAVTMPSTSGECGMCPRGFVTPVLRRSSRIPITPQRYHE